MHKVIYIKDDASASYKLLRRQFQTMDYQVSEAVLDDHRQVTFTSPAGRAWTTSVAKINYPFTTPTIGRIADNKEIAYDFAQSLGVSTPFTRLVTPGDAVGPDQIEALLARYPKLIVKPANASLSHGLTLNIQSSEVLLAAVARARRHSTNVLIQQQVEGEEVRFIVLDGKVVAALLRRTARVIGDGVSTVAELIKRENRSRHNLDVACTYPSLSAALIGEAALIDQTQLPLGEVRELNRSTMIRSGASIYSVLDQVHPSYLATTEKLAASLGATFIVVDILLSDFSSAQTESNYWFIEFNTSPVLALCYDCRDGRMFDIVPMLAGAIDQWLDQPQPADLLLTEA